MKNKTVLFLIPTPISPDESPAREVLEILPRIDFFVCERNRTTRRWLRTVLPDYDIDSHRFFEFDKHRNRFPLDQIKRAWQDGKTGGLTSEAGTPAVADPGFGVVAEAHRAGVTVRPLPGNNSLILGLMASGLNGNQFTYHGYFPIDLQALKSQLKSLFPMIEKGYTQIFIETPYRNRKTLETLLRLLPAGYRLSVSAGLLTESEDIRTMTISEWKTTDTTYLHKTPAVYYIGL